MGFWREAIRPHCHGLFVDGGVLYAQRSETEPTYRFLATERERREYLTPIAVPLQNSRVFLDIEVGEPRPVDVPPGARAVIPSERPKPKGRKTYTIAVYTGDNDVYVGYAASGVEARGMFRAVEKLVKEYSGS